VQAIRAEAMRPGMGCLVGVLAGGTMWAGLGVSVYAYLFWC
jgi:hypothetical protein